jgi:hypothetical protein
MDAWALAFSPNETALAAACADGTVRIWDLASRRERAALVGHQSTAEDARFSPDGSLLASLDREGTVLVWNLRDLWLGLPFPYRVADAEALLARVEQETGLVLDGTEAVPSVADGGQADDEIERWATLMAVGRTADATRRITDFNRRLVGARWPIPIVRHLAGALGEQELLAAADHRDAQETGERRCQAGYYLGILRLEAGDQDAARRHFAACEGIEGVSESSLAAQELARLAPAAVK